MPFFRIPRLHLVELEDLSWFPGTLRDLATDYLQFVEDRLRFHEPVIPVLTDLLARAETDRLIDLCSGGVGPWLGLERDLRGAGVPVQVTLTDKYPHLQAFQRAADASGGRIDHSVAPIDAMDVPADLSGVRTLFNSFHHFRPSAARRVLQNAVDAKQPIAIFEIPDRTLFSLLSILLFSPLAVLFSTPLIRPFRWKRLLFTYPVPAVPFTCVWDGTVSQLRAYTTEELLELGRSVDREGYLWASGRSRIRETPLHMTYLTGFPRGVGTPP